jgi:signal transduction histidine kinase/DNA-binding response OmpR family regulator
VQNIVKDYNDNIWISTKSGLLEKFSEKEQSLKQFCFDTHPFIRSICPSKNGELWLGRDILITRFKPENGLFDHYYSRDSYYWMHLYPKINDWVRILQRKNRLIASINKVGNNANVEKSFELTDTTEVLIIAQGEGSRSRMNDTGWLSYAGSGKLIWKMTARTSLYAEGDSKNRIKCNVLTLPPGLYKLTYQTNKTHAYGMWVAEPPQKFDLWGIQVYSVPNTMGKKIRPFVNIRYKLIRRKEFSGLNYLFEDQQGVLWCLVTDDNNDLITYQFCKEKEQFISLIEAECHLISRYLNIMYQDGKGVLWFGSQKGGLVKYANIHNGISEREATICKRYSGDPENAMSIYGKHISSIVEDKTGIIWIGTNKGLFEFNPDTEIFHLYDKKDGIISGEIISLVEDEKGRIWLATNKGISKFEPDTKRFKNYDKDDGLPTIEFGPGAACISSTGTIYFGGKSGFITFHPDSLKDNTYIPQLSITKFQIFNKTILPTSDSPLQKSISYTKELILSHDQDVFSFEFTGLDFTNAKKNKYAYKMEGIDPDWVFTNSDRRYATYTKLPPGDYLFRIKGSNNDGLWNEVGTTLKVIILPPWWKTNLAYFIYIFFILSAFFAAWRLQTNRLKIKHRMEIEHLQVEKLAELDRMKSQFFANISHEFRTPLTLILGPLEKIISGSLRSNLTEQYKIMRRNAKRLLQLINQILDLSKLESGKLRLHASPVKIALLLRRIVQQFESQALIRHIRLELNTDSGETVVYLDQDKFETIIENLLSNAFKYTPDGGEILVDLNIVTPEIEQNQRKYIDYEQNSAEVDHSCKQQNGSIIITIFNTGLPIPAGDIDRIFDRYYQAKDRPNEYSGGTGIGLALTKELVILHHGEIRVNSKRTDDVAVSEQQKKHIKSPNNLLGKTTFTILLPMGKEHLSEDEIDDSVVSIEEIMDKIPDRSDSAEEKSKITKQDSVSGQKDKPLILIVEDNSDLRQYLAESLDYSYKIIEAEDGQKGFDMTIRFIPDLIISDVMMPVIDGFKLCQNIKSDERSSHIPFILLTARAAKEDRIVGLETGADDYISKPFDSQELLLRVKNLIRQRRLLAKRFSSSVGLRPEDITVSSADKRFLQKALEIIELHMADPSYQVNDFIREMNFSRSQFHRKIKALTDQSAAEFMRAVRLNRAAQLLKQKMDNISQVAYAVGFKNPSHFATSFRAFFGVSPKDYLNQASDNI